MAAILTANITIDKEQIRAIAKELSEGYAGAINDYIASVKNNIEIAQNVYTEMGLEISLDLLKDALKNHGIELEELQDIKEGTKAYE